LDAVGGSLAMRGKMAQHFVPGTAEPQGPGPERLLGRLAARDPNALGELYDTTSRLVFGLVYRIVGDHASAEEVTLDVYLQVWRQAEKYDPSRASFVSWLMLLARSRALDYLRSKPGRARRQEQELDPREHEGQAESATPDQDAWAADRRQAITAALRQLDEGRRVAIELAFYEGCSHSEIADRLNLPLGTVKTRIRAGMQQLREQLQPYRGAM
jgi:RNA polymerase sigma-70 factor (ECF subfamily)